MKFCVLCSSSSGNCVYVELNNNGYLLDCGVSARQIELKLSSIGVNPRTIKGIFVTHEHSDHVTGLAGFYKKYQPVIYLTKGTYKGLKEQDRNSISPIYCKFVKNNEETEIDGFTVLSFPTSHDVNDPCGFKITENGKSLVYLTDTGVFEKRDELVNSDAYILESNHEPDMLLLSNRPWPLKNRIMSKTGHLSNEDSAELFSKLYGNNTKRLVLFHLSSECNTKDLALLAYESYFRKTKLDISKISITVSDKNIPTKLMEV